MSEVEHSLAALLREGATPTANEVEDLSAIGRFVSEMVARLTSGLSATGMSALTVGRGLETMDRFEETSPILSAATADRWLEAMGSGSAMLEPRLSRPTGVDVDPFAWSKLVQDAIEDLPIVRLIERHRRPQQGGSTSEGRRAPARSLFGPETPRQGLDFTPYEQSHRATAARRDRGDTSSPAGGPVEPAAPVILADGSKMAPEVVSTLVQAGLSLTATPASSPSMLRLDGLGINHRTPALASALGHVAGPSPSGAGDAPLAKKHSVGSPERMGARVIAALEPRDLAAAPRVQLAGAYDSVAGDFLHVVPPVLGVSPAASPGMTREPMTSEPSSPATTQVSLAAIVPPQPSLLRPFTGGVFPSASADQRSALVGAQHSPSGMALPLTERGPIGPPLVRAHETPAAPASTPELGPAQERSTGSLAGITRSEQMAARVLGGRDAGRAVSEGFSPVVTSAPSVRGAGGLDEVAWVSMSAPRDLSPSALASLPVGRALPLSTGSDVARAAASPPPSSSGDARSGDSLAPTRQPSTQPRTPITLSPDEPTALLRRASRARKALGRTALTAREIQEVAPFLASLVAEPRSDEHPALMPSLVNRLGQRTNSVQGMESIRHLDPALGERLLSRIAGPTQTLSPAMKSSLIQAGWSGAELELLQLDGRAGGRDAPRAGAPESDVVDAGLMRKVARVITGTESLSGPERFGGLDETPVGRRSDLGYFEGVAPPSLRGSRSVDLNGAIGELLALAQVAGAPKDSAMSAVLGRLQGAEQLLVPAQPTPSEQTLVKPSTLSRRVAAAASRVGQGPAGLERLTQRPNNQGHDVGLDMRLGSALAPELMLPGLADPEALREGRGFETSREIVQLGAVGSSPARSVASITSGPIETAGETEATMSRPGRPALQMSRPGRPAVQMSRPGRPAVQMSRPGRPAVQMSRPGRPAVQRSMAPVAGFSPELLHGVARGREAAGPVAGRQRELTSFGNAWLSRVDGARTGLELGIDPEQTPFSAAFGAEPEGTRTALTDDLHLVNTTSSSSEAASGVSRIDGAARRGREGGATRGASSPRAARNKGASLRYVDVGGRGAGPRRDLDQMSARVRGTSMGGERSSMPLIANSMQAVAQSAMRSATTERAPGDRVHEERVSSATHGAEAESGAGAQENTLSKEAFEALAQQMADRVARELKRERERRGQWT